jgi:hypothetical protein
VEFRWKNGDSDFSVTFDQAVTLRQWSSVSVTRNDKNKYLHFFGVLLFDVNKLLLQTYYHRWKSD